MEYGFSSCTINIIAISAYFRAHNMDTNSLVLPDIICTVWIYCLTNNISNVNSGHYNII